MFYFYSITVIVNHYNFKFGQTFNYLFIYTNAKGETS